MVGISIKVKTPDQCHLPADSDKRYLSFRQAVSLAAQQADPRGRLLQCRDFTSASRVMRQFGAKFKKTLGAWAGNGLASKCGDDKDAIAMI
jgi:hypothetical protein